MTNGEKIKEIFPKLEWVFNAESEYYKTHIDGIHKHCFDSDWWHSEYKEPTTKNDFAFLALLEKTYNDFRSCEGGEGWLKIDGKEYSTDAGYALEGMSIFMEVFKRRLAEAEQIIAKGVPIEQEPKTGHWIINKEKSLAKCSNCKFLLKNKDEIKLLGTFIQGYNHCPYCGCRMVEPQESEET